MRIASYVAGGRESDGAVVGDGIVDLGRRLPYPTLAGDARAPGAGRGTGGFKGGAGPTLSDVRLLTPVPDAGKIICIGRNYRGHVAEGNTWRVRGPPLW